MSDFLGDKNNRLLLGLVPNCRFKTSERDKNNRLFRRGPWVFID